MWSAIHDQVVGVAAGLLSALLPSPERDRLKRAIGVDPPRWSLALGALELGSGTALFMVGGIRFVTGQSSAMSLGLLEFYPPDLSTTDLQATGLVAWLTWLLHPAAWLYAALALVGLVRVIAFAATREAVAEPLVWAALRGAQAWDARRFRRRREARFGPMRPDRVEQAADGRGITVFAAREKPEWREEVTIEIDDRFYRLVAVDEAESVDAAGSARWTSMVYTLREIDATGLIRSLVRYRPPVGPTRGSRGPS